MATRGYEVSESEYHHGPDLRITAADSGRPRAQEGIRQRICSAAAGLSYWMAIRSPCHRRDGKSLQEKSSAELRGRRWLARGLAWPQRQMAADWQRSVRGLAFPARLLGDPFVGTFPATTNQHLRCFLPFLCPRSWTNSAPSFSSHVGSRLVVAPHLDT